jgi:CheY-like chemotaxis protein
MDKGNFLDRTVLARLGKLEPNLPRKLVDLFLEHTPGRLDSALAGGRAGDWKAVEAAAHSLKSSAGNLGAHRLRHLADRVESLAASMGASAGAAAATGDRGNPAARAGELGALLGDLAETYARTKQHLLAEKDLRAAKRKPCVAVVEDNPDNRLLVRALLEDRYDLVEYGHGREALAGLARTPVDLVLMDISLPEMDGCEVLRRLRADPRLARLPVIALTAHAMAGDREKFLGAGFDGYVTKPIVEEADLLACIRACLDARTPG